MTRHLGPRGSALETEAFLRQVEAAYLGSGDPARAPAMAAYMKDRFRFLGIGAPMRREIDRGILASAGMPSEAQLPEIVRWCWAREEREFQYFATKLLRRSASNLPAHFVDELEWLITTKSWWDTVDELGVHVAGPLVAAHATLSDRPNDWIRSDDLWLARTAILYQLLYADRTDADRLFAYCRRRAADTDFFMRKAIGWALRQYARVDPEAVVGFVADMGDSLSGLSRREALKRVSTRQGAKDT